MAKNSESGYNLRIFYGPLEPDADPALAERLDAMKHPDDPARIIRTGVVKAFKTGEALREELNAARDLLDRLEQRGIPHVHPEYLDNNYEEGDIDRPVLAIAMDKITGGVNAESILQSGELTNDHIREFDGLIGKLSQYVIDTKLHGGPISPEMLYLEQFVYVADEEPGQRLVLVDVEPVHTVYIEPGQHEEETSTVMTILAADIFMVKSARPDVELVSLPIAFRAIDMSHAGLKYGARQTAAAKALLIEGVYNWHADDDTDDE